MRVCPKCKSSFGSQTQFCGIDGSRLVSVPDDPLVGTTIGKYRIEAPIGKGASGCVYRAVHEELGSEFAVKVLLGELSADEEVVRRFRREAVTASKIRSGNVVSVVDVGQTDEGLVYLVMEYAPGRPLNQVIKADAPFEPVRAARLVRDIALGLAAAHDRGFVHRDVKPANVFVASDGSREVARVLDFGIVRHDVGQDMTKITQEGQIIGTPAFMSPEQWEGAEVGPEADLYALGVILYEMLSGQKPFRAQGVVELMGKHATEVPPLLPPAGGLEDLARRLLLKAPDERAGPAHAVAEECEEIIGVIAMATGSTRLQRSAPPPAIEQAPASQTAAADVPVPKGKPNVLPLLLTGAFVVGAALVGAKIFDGSAPASSVDPQAIVSEVMTVRGLTPEDLRWVPAVQPQQRAWELARVAPDLDKRRSAATAYVEAIREAPLSQELLRNKLLRLDTPLSQAVENLDRRGKQLLEQRYSRLFDDVNTSQSQKSLRDLLARINAFARELGR